MGPKNLVTSTCIHLCTSRKMQVSGATELASKGPGVSGSCNLSIKPEIDDSHEVYKIRCPCGSSLQTDSMIKVRLLTFFVHKYVSLPSLKSQSVSDYLSSLRLLHELAVLVSCMLICVDFNVIRIT